MEMWRLMVTDIHVDYNSVEATDFGHTPKFLC